MFIHCIIYTFSTSYIQFHNCMNASHLAWRPPYPSENLKTPRFVKTKTYSTTNPYAIQEPTQANEFQELKQSQQSQQSQQSKRENNSDKIYERGPTPQVGMNPFLQGNYLQDLETHDEFLKKDPSQ